MAHGTTARRRRNAQRAQARKQQLAVAPDTPSTEDLNEDPTEAALASLEAFAAPAPCANCSHAYSMHLGDNGPCSVEDCSCNGYVGADEEAAAEPDTLAAALAALNDAVTRLTALDNAVAQLAATVQPLYVNTAVPSFSSANASGTITFVPGETAPPVVTPPAAALTGERRWTATLAPEGVLTDDGRMFAPGAISWRELPLSLMAMTKTADGHDGAEVAGRIDRIYREGNLIRGEGVFDDGKFGQEIARMVDDRTLRGVSVDIAVREFETRYKSEVVGDEAPAAEAEGEPNLLDMLMGGEDLVSIVLDGVIGAVTVCPFPAFAEASISIAASLVAAASPSVWTLTFQPGWVQTLGPEREIAPVEEVVTASAAGIAPLKPPAEWFANPELSELTGLSVDDDGRIYGHAAAWDVCHIGIPDACTTAPHSKTEYAYYHLKEVECEDGSRVACGTITLEAPHADRRLGRQDAAAHYDNTGLAAADVVCGEDEFGIWVAGALRSDVDAEKVRALRGAVLSGDWRDVNGNLELVALLAVNVPGFPVPRPRALVASGEDGQRVMTLVAAGAHDGKRIIAPTPNIPDNIAAELAGIALSEIAASAAS